MAFIAFDVRHWNLALPFGLLVGGCGERLISADSSDTDVSATDSQTGPTTGPTTDPTAGECKTNADCGYSEQCIDGRCEYYCADYCCAHWGEYDPRCSPPPYYDCYSDLDCGPYGLCSATNGWGGFCDQAQPVPDCGPLAMVIDIPVPDGLIDDVIALQLVDVDQDQVDDIVIASAGAAQIVLGPGMQAPIDLPVAMDLDPTAIVAGDFAGGGTDLAISRATGGFILLWSDGGGGYTDGGQIGATVMHGMMAADFDGEGHVDLAARVDLEIRTWLANGMGGFSTYNVGPASSGLAAAALDSDSAADLVVQEAGGLVVYRGSPLGLQMHEAHSLTGNLTNLVVADFDGDGDRDATLQQYAGSDLAWTALRRFVNDGNANLTQETILALPAAHPLVAAGDFNGDGKHDLVRAGGGMNMHIDLGGSSGFSCTQSFASPTVPVALAVGDFDGDGNAEVAISGAGGLYVLDPYP